jgi:hypothetical protein
MGFSQFDSIVTDSVKMSIIHFESIIIHVFSNYCYKFICFIEVYQIL